jgi:hypothetical protein
MGKRNHDVLPFEEERKAWPGTMLRRKSGEEMKIWCHLEKKGRGSSMGIRR